ncbi:hypothetical protein QBC39DRAFT_35596 [Podospora conica]|nr:hypothetical protein QBC39DRAFT_35596 [Schizothecium conicum]
MNRVLGLEGTVGPSVISRVCLFASPPLPTCTAPYPTSLPTYLRPCVVESTRERSRQSHAGAWTLTCLLQSRFVLPISYVAPVSPQDWMLPKDDASSVVYGRGGDSRRRYVGVMNHVRASPAKGNLTCQHCYRPEDGSPWTWFPRPALAIVDSICALPRGRLAIDPTLVDDRTPPGIPNSRYLGGSKTGDILPVLGFGFESSYHCDISSSAST